MSSLKSNSSSPKYFCFFQVVALLKTIFIFSDNAALEGISLPETFNQMHKTKEEKRKEEERNAWRLTSERKGKRKKKKEKTTKSTSECSSFPTGRPCQRSLFCQSKSPRRTAQRSFQTKREDCSLQSLQERKKKKQKKIKK